MFRQEIYFNLLLQSLVYNSGINTIIFIITTTIVILIFLRSQFYVFYNGILGTYLAQHNFIYSGQKYLFFLFRYSLSRSCIPSLIHRPLSFCLFISMLKDTTIIGSESLTSPLLPYFTIELVQGMVPNTTLFLDLFSPSHIEGEMVSHPGIACPC